MSMEYLALFSLGGSCEQLGNQCDLASDISFVYPLYLSLSYHVHHLKSLEGSPGCLEGEKAHSWLCKTFDKAVILFGEVVEVLHLPQFAAFRDDLLGFELLEGLWIRGILVHIDHTKGYRMSGSERFVEKTLRRLGITCRTQPEIKRVP